MQYENTILRAKALHDKLDDSAVINRLNHQVKDALMVLQETLRDPELSSEERSSLSMLFNAGVDAFNCCNAAVDRLIAYTFRRSEVRLWRTEEEAGRGFVSRYVADGPDYVVGHEVKFTTTPKGVSIVICLALDEETEEGDAAAYGNLRLTTNDRERLRDWLTEHLERDTRKRR